MHILFLTDNFPPEVNAPASRTHEHAREWVHAGEQVTVITCAPNFPKGKVFDGYRNRVWQTEQIDGIRVIRVWSYMTANEGFALRVLDYLSFMMSAFVASFFVRRVDVIVATSPQFFTACAGWMVSKVKRRPWVFELRDIWPESIRAVGAMRESRVLDILERVEMFLYRRAHAIVAVTHAFRETLIARGVAPVKIHVVTNGVDLTRYTPRPKDAVLKAELGLEGRFVVGYIGTHGMAHALDTLLDAAVMLRDDARPVTVLLLGDGADRARLQARASEEKIDNVLFVKTVPKDQVARYWSLLDASIIHLRNSSLFRTVIPSKLFECMAMGIPVIHGVEGESAEIVEKSGVGLMFPPEDADALAAAVRRLRDDLGLTTRLAAAGPEAAKLFDRVALAARMLGILGATSGRGQF